MKKRTILLLFTLFTVFGSNFLPYLVRKFFLADPYIFPDGKDLGAPIEYDTGFDLLYPLLALPAFLIAFVLITFVRNKMGNILALALACLNVSIIVIIYFMIHTTLSFFGVQNIETGIGFYVLGFGQILLVGVSMYNIVRPVNSEDQLQGEELLDGEL